MTVEFIATLDTAGLAGDPGHPARIAGRHEEAGFDRLLIDDAAGSPDAMSVASQVLTATARLGVLVTCRPALVAPAVAARQYATLAAFHPGRVALRLAAGSDGDRARCAHEFLDVVRLAWKSAEPFRYAGACYLTAGTWSAVRPRGGRLPVYLAGDSGAALRLAARHADVCIVPAGPRAGRRARLAAVRAAAARHGRAPRLGVIVSPAGRAPAAAAVGELMSLGVGTLLAGGGPAADLAGWARLIRQVRARTGGDGCLVA